MKRVILLLVLISLGQVGVLSSTLAKSSGILKNQSLKLYRGEVRVLKIGEVDRVAVGNGKILSTSITKKGQLIILAEKTGETIIHIWGKKGWERDLKIKISPSNPQTAVSEIRALLHDSKGLKVRSVGGRTVIDGDVGPADAAKLKVIQKYYPNTIVLARTTAASFHDKMIHMKVQITEFSSNALEEVGINWSTNINGPAWGVVATPSTTYPADPNGIIDTSTVLGKQFGFFGIATAMTSRINLMVSNGDALILAAPTLTARSGGEAEFLSGGEIPLETSSQNGTNIEFKEYGIKLKIKPVADDDNNITARIETELSAPDPSTAVKGTPGFLTRKASADLSMRNKETIVISGLLNSELSKDVSKVKYLSSIPLLGALFRNTKTRDKKTELVIFVTPTIFDANSEINKQSVAQHDQLIKRFRDAVELREWMKKGSANSDLLE